MPMGKGYSSGSKSAVKRYGGSKNELVLPENRPAGTGYGKGRGTTKSPSGMTSGGHSAGAMGGGGRKGSTKGY